MSGEGKALLAVGKAQGALLKLTRDLLKEDAGDGLRIATWTARHKTFFHELCGELRSHGQVDDADIDSAERAAGI